MNNKKIYIIIAGVLVIIAIVVGVVLTGKKTQTVKTEKKASSDEEIIPTVDSSVQVDLVGLNANKEIKISLAGIISGTQTIEYTLSYNTKAQGFQGIMGTIELKNNETEHEMERELGTCSSGKCVYHIVDGPIKLELKFNGDYGSRLFSKEYSL